ncbi:EAL domain-containing protein [Billgrantia gudaonensis]|uniref:EAL domain-containing protein n=1 Tax=Billgrantia gudaonensis TaxID=376427 RepID=A0A432JJM9_9GAMM|nr:EAL domain-containing protein [Halomonas gudaonensis]
MHDISAAWNAIARCQALEVQVAIDDFGTGFSSLTYLRQLPVISSRWVSCATCFVRRRRSSHRRKRDLHGPASTGSCWPRRGEHRARHGTARVGCRLAQGYGIARPMPAELLDDWLEAWPEALRVAGTGTGSTPACC